MATTEENKTVKATEKKVVAPKATVKKVEAKVEETVNTVKETATKVTTSVSDAAKSSVDSVKDTYTDVENAVKDARVSGNARAVKILNAFFNDKANDKVANFVGYIGEASAVCTKIGCAPMSISANKIHTLYKKITA